jgi:DNA-binding transcriptional LysR family regulator
MLLPKSGRFLKRIFVGRSIRIGDVIRNLDLGALRSFLAVAESGGVTRAAGMLNLTQSAVSMQIKRLEEALGLRLLERTGRGVALSPAGEQLAGYARRMLALNDEAWARLTSAEYEGEITLGAPHDVIHPVLPRVLQRFTAAFPRMQIRLISANTLELKAAFVRGGAELILATEGSCAEGGEMLAEEAIVWIGAAGGQAFRQRPLRLAFCDTCCFRPIAVAALEAADIPWERAVSAVQIHAVEAVVGADLAVATVLEGAVPAGAEVLPPGALPPLGVSRINLYVAPAARSEPVAALAAMVREGFAADRRRARA